MKGKHLWFMLLGCIIAAFGLFMVFQGRWQTVGLLLFLACPAMHLFMMRGMHGNHHDHSGHHEHEKAVPSQHHKAIE